MELYIHIPFCVRKCEYCSFASFSASESQKDAYIEALLREAEIRSAEFTEPVLTVFIGGGTPSLLTPYQLDRLITGLRKQISFDNVEEFSIEANPGTLTVPFFQSLKELGINRLSLGMQASQDRLLALLGRIHRFREVKQSVELAREYGIGNINLDLIFGIPGQTPQDWDETLEAAVSLHPEHISAYGLIPEEGTPLFRRLEKKELVLPDPDTERNMYYKAIRTLFSKGYHQYEISNFSKDGFECRHNMGYWTQIPYVGLGISAASMRIVNHEKPGMKCIRRTNPDDPDRYNQMIHENDSSLADSETVQPDEARFETMMLALRMNRGISDERFLKLHGIPIDACYGPQLQRMRENGLLLHENGTWRLSRKGMDIQNSILVELMDG